MKYLKLKPVNFFILLIFMAILGIIISIELFQRNIASDSIFRIFLYALAFLIFGIIYRIAGHYYFESLKRNSDLQASINSVRLKSEKIESELLRMDKSLAAQKTEFQRMLSSIESKINLLLSSIESKINLLLKSSDEICKTLEIHRTDAGLKNGKTLIAKISDLKTEISQVYMQTDALFSLYHAIKPDFPLPQMRGWVASPDFLNRICIDILSQKPQLVFETGSGVSTLVIASCLKRNGGGLIISLDHLEEYAETTRGLLTLHGLEEFARVCFAPLTNYSINGESWSWYNLDSINFEREIDFLVVDGPPASIQELSRYPVLPLLRAKLAKNILGLFDDGARTDEKEIILRYQSEFPEFSFQFLPFEKGAFAMTRKNVPPAINT